MAAGYGVRLVEQAVAYLARQMRAQAVKLGPEHLELVLLRHLLREAVPARRPCRPVRAVEFGGRAAGRGGAASRRPRARSHTRGLRTALGM